VLGYDSTSWVESTGSIGALTSGPEGQRFLRPTSSRSVVWKAQSNLDDKVVGVVLPFHQSPLRLLLASDVLRAARSRRAG
jgi:hypothetical protein